MPPTVVVFEDVLKMVTKVAKRMNGWFGQPNVRKRWRKEQTFVCDLPCAFEEESILDVALLRCSGDSGHGVRRGRGRWRRGEVLREVADWGSNKYLLASLSWSGPPPGFNHPTNNSNSALFSLFLRRFLRPSPFFDTVHCFPSLI